MVYALFLFNGIYAVILALCAISGVDVGILPLVILAVLNSAPVGLYLDSARPSMSASVKPRSQGKRSGYSR